MGLDAEQIPAQVGFKSEPKNDREYTACAIILVRRVVHGENAKRQKIANKVVDLIVMIFEKITFDIS